MSNEQHASTATADIDSIALDVARRFTEEWDPQRRASLQVAIIEAIRTAHPQPAELAEQQGCSTFDVTDPWRGLYLPARMPAPSEYGDLTHPDIPLWPDDREDALDKLVHAQGFDFHIVAGDFTEAAMEDGDELYWQEMRAWNPEAPQGEWRLAWKGDTEDGPYAWFVRPMALRPESVATRVQGIDLGQLERIRNELHAMSSQVPDEWIDPIVELQQDVQKLIDGPRDATPGVGNG